MFNRFSGKKPIIGMIHLPALPGYKESPGIKEIINKAVQDLNTLQKAGYDCALVENDGDHPPYIGPNKDINKDFATVMSAILKEAKIPIGMEILYDMSGTVEVAAKVGAQFVRLDVFVDAGITRYGPTIRAEAKKIATLRDALDPKLLIFADVQVKHLTMVNPRPITESVQDAISNRADAVIITGVWTGREPTIEDCQDAKSVAGRTPVLIGSGLNVDNAAKFLGVLDGGIVGTSIKTGEYVDLDKAVQLRKKAKSV